MELTVQVRRKTVEAEGICGFELVAADGGELPPFEAGAHLDVHAPGGHLRQYSLCNAPGERHRYQLAVLREPKGRGGSAAMHDEVLEGDTLLISAPRNYFPLREDAAFSLLLAGGIGITPLLAMAERMHAIGRTFVLHYAARSARRMAFTERLRAAPFAHNVHMHLDDGAPAQKLGLTRLFQSAPPGAHAYICGPRGFLDVTRAAAAGAGWPELQVHFEYFAGGQPHGPRDRHFDVVIRSTGAVIPVEATQTVTEALKANGIEVVTSCEQGVCGTCLTRVLEGEIEHKDLFLTPEEQATNKAFLPCCSRARSQRLVLDI